MRFSLVLATVGRVEEVKRFLASLDAQTYQDFDLIIVDQNPDNRLEPLVEPYLNRLSILHLRTPCNPGASRARNAGLQHVKGDVVSCPDDDCWYPPGLLEQVTRCLQENPDIDGVSGRLASNPEALEQNLDPDVGPGALITGPFGVLKVPGMVGLFLRTPVVKKVGSFDETLGPGAGTPWGAGEDTDYHLRILKAGFSLCYNTKLVVYHPAVDSYYAEGRDLVRSYRYGAGGARVGRRHGFPLWYFAYEASRSLAGVLLGLARWQPRKAYWHWGAFRGKINGWFSGR